MREHRECKFPVCISCAVYAMVGAETSFTPNDNRNIQTVYVYFIALAMSSNIYKREEINIKQNNQLKHKSIHRKQVIKA